MKLIVLLESARAVWDMRAIITASPRIEQAGLERSIWLPTLVSILTLNTIPSFTRAVGWPSKRLPPG